uniref:Uncharacterized protein n=1 Tax=Anguilla anguilla TaxID=7936 RepID=A0A0E9P7F9_ANGAN
MGGGALELLNQLEDCLPNRSWGHCVRRFSLQPISWSVTVVHNVWLTFKRP